MASGPSLTISPVLPGQFPLCCRSCGSPQTRVRGFCASCYAARRRDFLYFGGLRRRVLERDRRRCRVCGQAETGKTRIHVHHRRPGISREKLLVSLCPACHARVHRLQVLDRVLPPLAEELWRELHPRAPEQIFLGFGPEAPGAPVWLWEGERAG
jgi:5-methylcytosine-specific restriction endonuclease McrA